MAKKQTATKSAGKGSSGKNSDKRGTEKTTAADEDVAAEETAETESEETVATVSKSGKTAKNGKTADEDAGKGKTDGEADGKSAGKGSDKGSAKKAAAKKAAAKASGKGKGPAKSGPKSSSAFDKGKTAPRKGRAVQVKQPKPWGLIWTFAGVGVVALGLIGAAIYVVWDRSQPPEGVTDFYGEYGDYAGVQSAIQDGSITEDDLENPWVVQQNHVDAAEGWDGTNPTYELSPPAGGNHLSQWQTCNGSVYDAPIVDGNGVHSMEHGAVWLTYDPALVDGDGIDQLATLVNGRDYSLMSPYPEQGVEVSLQAWGVQYQTDDLNDPKIEEFLDFYIQNGDNLAEMNATCSGGVSTTIEDAPAA